MSISRAQLAAALVEYDNDDVAPYQRKNHRESALFTHFQPGPPPPPQLPSHPSGIPHHNDEQVQPHQHRRSTSSEYWRSPSDPNNSHRPAEAPQPLGYSPELEEDVDVSRWGLPDHLISTAPAKSPDLINPMMASRSSMPSITTRSASTPVPNPESSPFQHRARSIHLDHPDNPDNASRPIFDSGRRRSSMELDREAEMVRRRTQSVYLSGADEALAAADRALTLAGMPRARSVAGVLGEYGESGRVREPMMIPLPSSPTSVHTRPLSSMSRGRSFDMDRRRSSIGDAYMEAHNEEEELSTPNPFALPAPPSSQASRFDPKYAESSASPPLLQSDRRSSTMSNLDPNRISQSHSQPSLSRISTAPQSHSIPPRFSIADDPSRPTYVDIPTPGEFGKPLIPPKYARRQPHPDRRSLLRPRTLIMPASLQGMDYIPEEKVRAGFTLGEKPLPAGARSSILSMGAGGVGEMWRGPGGLPGQVGEVQQQGREFGRGLAQELQFEEEEDRLNREEEEEGRMRIESRKRDKMPGKLYGTSLMDQLEARKQYTKNKQRTFSGDSRPTMFARQSTYLPNSTSTPLLSPHPQTSPQRPLISPPGTQLQQLHSTSPDKTNRQSLRAPLLQFDGNDPNISPSPADANASRPGSMPRSRSVFGVDELWEKEMAKLKIIQAEEEARKARQLEDAEREKEKKKKGWLGGGRDKGKGKGKERESLGSPGQAQSLSLSPRKDGGGFGGAENGGMGGYPGGVSPIKKKVGDLPPTLQYSPEKASVPTALPEVDARRRPASRAGLDGWASEDEDEQEARRRAKGKGKANPGPVYNYPAENSDSEDDVPLSRIIPPTSRQTSGIRLVPQPDSESDSDEDVPLSRLAPRITPLAGQPLPAKLNSDVHGSLGLSVPALPPSVSPRPPTITPDFNPLTLPVLSLPTTNEDEDDDRPLGLRASRSNLASLALSGGPGERTEAEKAEIEDDLPLGFKHAGAAQRQVSGNSQMADMGMQGQGYGGWGGMQGYAPYPPQQAGWGMPHMPMPMQMPQMQMGGMGSMYGMMSQGYQPGYGGGFGAQPLPMSTSGLPFLPAPQGPMVNMEGLGPAPPGPGQNIDSWRKGVRAPSTVGTEGARG